MKTTTFAVLAALGACRVGAGPEPATSQAPRPPGTPSFFLTSRGVDGSADLGGLAGADAHCRTLAEAAGAGDRTWRAYLSAGAADARVDARDRIGPGPWYNVRGQLIARDLDELHGDRTGIGRRTALTEEGEAVLTVHDVLTGSTADGRLAVADGRPLTCGDWTADGDGAARVGHHDRMDPDSHDNPRFPYLNGSWAAAHDTLGCDAERLSQTGGAGQFYCFAADPAQPAPRAAERPFGYRRGLNVNHWLGDNMLPEVHPDSTYGADWFDEQDVDWIAEQGFDHLRITVDGHRWVRGSGEIEEAAVARFDQALAWADARGLGVVLAMYSFPGFRAHARGEMPREPEISPFEEPTSRADAAYVWWLVAHRYRDVGNGLRFELIRQPTTDDPVALRDFQAEALAMVRRVDPTRFVYLAAARSGPPGVAAPEDPRSALAVPFWEPRAFTRRFDRTLPAVAFPDAGPGLTPEAVDAGIAGLVEAAGPREIYVASWGVYESADDASAVRYVRTTRGSLERHGLPWAIYDYHTGCAVRGADGGPTRILKGLWPPAPR